ncbi:MAG: hypothetical protein ACR2P8_12780 [Myxococcota bacterium]
MRRARRHGRGLFVAAASVAALTLAGCHTTQTFGGGPVVQEERSAPNGDALRRVAVVPFHFADSLRAQLIPDRDQPPSERDNATVVETFFADVLAGEGVGVIPPSEVESAATAEGGAVPRVDPRAAIDLASRRFEATGVILGRVTRFRERVGGAAGAMSPASVAFEASLFDVRSGTRIWRGRFDLTQQSLTANVVRARQLPGGGTRWLSASELARWGAEQMVRQLLADTPPSEP